MKHSSSPSVVLSLVLALFGVAVFISDNFAATALLATTIDSNLDWTGHAYWDYYGYHDDSDGSYQDIYASRNFRANPEDVLRSLCFLAVRGEARRVLAEHLWRRAI